MKQSLVLLTLLALVSVAHAHQDPARPGRLKMTRGLTLASASPGWLEKEINLNIKNEKPGDAIKQVLRAAGKSADKVEIDEGVAAPQISLSIKNVQTRDALAAIGRLAGATAYVTDDDDKIVVRLKKRSAVEVYTVSGFSSFPAEARKDFENALVTSREALAQIRTRLPEIVSMPGRPGFPANATLIQSFLPSKMVSLDVKDQDIREVLKTLLKQADVSYVLEEDIPEGKRHSFTFENVSLRTALDVVCESVGIGWGVKRSENKPLVQIGKKWAKKSLLGQSGPGMFPHYFDTSPGTDFSFTFPEIIGAPDFPVLPPTPVTTWGTPEIIL